jgi:hypothetical protein
MLPYCAKLRFFAADRDMNTGPSQGEQQKRGGSSAAGPNPCFCNLTLLLTFSLGHRNEHCLQARAVLCAREITFR